MRRSLVIIKLGGSVITDKGRGKRVFRKDQVKRLAKEIFEARKKKDCDLIIAHGAGSFGHPLAVKYKLHQGYLGPESFKGFVLTKKAMYDLSLLVWREFSRAGLLACVVEPASHMVVSDGKIQKFDGRFIKLLVKRNIIPILFGDVVFDQKQGIAIVSADQIVSKLARMLGASKVIFVSDVEGVFDKNPKVYKDAKLIREINSKNYEEVLSKMHVHNKNDVTGEMKGKLMAIKNELEDMEVRIISGFIENNLRMLLLGGSSGTRILL